MAAKAMAHGEVTQSTAIRTPMNSIPNEAGQVLRFERHHVVRMGIPEARATMHAVSALLTMKNVRTAATTPGTAVMSLRLDGPRSSCHTSPQLAAISTYCPGF